MLFHTKGWIKGNESSVCLSWVIQWEGGGGSCSSFPKFYSNAKTPSQTLYQTDILICSGSSFYIDYRGTCIHQTWTGKKVWTRSQEINSKADFYACQDIQSGRKPFYTAANDLGVKLGERPVPVPVQCVGWHPVARGPFCLARLHRSAFHCWSCSVAPYISIARI